MTYKFLKKIVDKGNYVKEDIQNKMDVFLMADRISIDEYQELEKIIKQ